jgi:hypothetical protein
VTPRLLTIMGSGETAPTMVKVHRSVIERLGPGAGPGLLLDTPFGFQTNAAEIAARAVTYFRDSVGAPLEVAGLRGAADLQGPAGDAIVAKLAAAPLVFAGPGSPTYALAQWAPLHFEEDLLSVLDKGGALSISSAASLTLGAYTAPIYEVYKVGDPAPTWRPGLDLLNAFGLRCVVIPHFDNNEGGNYDTRFCYLGEVRLVALEEQLPEDVATLGVDEHTAAIIDVASDTITVKGRSNAYWRLHGDLKVLANGTTTDLSELRNSVSTPRPQPRSTESEVGSGPAQLAQIASAGGDDATTALAQLVQLAATGGKGYIDPSHLVEGILKARVSARSSGQYELADELRDVLVAAGFEIHDEPSGTSWSYSTTD